nr:hypothetical protein [Deltaproteobacteria bacterium]
MGRRGARWRRQGGGEIADGAGGDRGTERWLRRLQQVDRVALRGDATVALRVEGDDGRLPLLAGWREGAASVVVLTGDLRAVTTDDGSPPLVGGVSWGARCAGRGDGGGEREDQVAALGLRVRVFFGGLAGCWRSGRRARRASLAACSFFCADPRAESTSANDGDRPCPS